MQLARQLRPALILLDLNMPGMDGFEVLAQLAEDPATSPLPVMIITSQILAPEQYRALTCPWSALKHGLPRPFGSGCSTKRSGISEPA